MHVQVLQLFIVVTLSATKYLANAKTKQPNVVLIVTDDMGWNDVGFHGSNQIPTPNIDALAYNGVILNRFYTQQTCTPSRTALLTGNYPIRSGMQGYPLRPGEDRNLPLDMPVLPEYLKNLGYSTHLIGKWHLGFSRRENTPNARGFDTFFGYWNGLISYKDYKILFDDGTDCNNGVDLHDNYAPAVNVKEKYATHLFTDKAKEIIEKQDPEKPMFLMVSHLAAHTGNEEDGNALTTPDLDETNKMFGYVDDLKRRNYTDIVYQVDKSVGAIIETLSKKNILENTIVIYMHDNGAQSGGDMHTNYGSNWPLRGEKFSLLEGGIRGTCVVYSPILQKTSYINNNLIHITDILPTLYALAGGENAHLGEIDGINQYLTIFNDTKTERKEFLINIDEVLDYSGYISHEGQYKLINKSYEKGIFDVYSGENGRGSENPEYNLENVLNSQVNLAINLIQSNPINDCVILDLRQQLDLSNCNRLNDSVNCTDSLCLFDLIKDPCESKNIINENKQIADEISEKLEKFYGEIVYQTLNPIDRNADPQKCGGVYFTWLDEDGCKNNSASMEISTFSKIFVIVLYVFRNIFI